MPLPRDRHPIVVDTAFVPYPSCPHDKSGFFRRVTNRRCPAKTGRCHGKPVDSWRKVFTYWEEEKTSLPPLCLTRGQIDAIHLPNSASSSYCITITHITITHMVTRVCGLRPSARISHTRSPLQHEWKECRHYRFTNLRRSAICYFVRLLRSLR